MAIYPWVWADSVRVVINNSPVIVARLGWRYIYWITAGLGTFAWFLLVAFVPETRFTRSDAELGQYLPCCRQRPLCMY